MNNDFSLLRRFYYHLPSQLKKKIIPSKLHKIAELESRIRYRINESSWYESAISTIYNSTVLPSPSIHVLDIGARWGVQTRLKIIDKRGALIYTGLEPDVEEAERLKQLYKGDENKTIYDTALSNSSSKQDLHITNHPGWSSLYEPNRNLLKRFEFYDESDYKIVDKETVRVEKLDEFYQTEDEEYDLIKIDTQGSEGDIITEGHNTLDQSLAIEFETHFKSLYNNQPLFYNVHQELSKMEYTLIDISVNKSYPRWATEGKSYSPMRDGEIVETNPLYMCLNVTDKVSLLKLIIISLIYRRKHIATHLLNKHSKLISQEEYESVAEILDTIPQVDRMGGE